MRRAVAAVAFAVLATLLPPAFGLAVVAVHMVLAAVAGAR